MRWQTQAIWPWLPGYKHMPLEILAHAHPLASHKMNRHLASNFWKICTFQRVAAHLFHGPRTATAVVVRPDYLHHFEHLAHISTFCGFSLGRFLIQSLSIICSHKFIHENARAHTHTHTHRMHRWLCKFNWHTHLRAYFRWNEQFPIPSHVSGVFVTLIWCLCSHSFVCRSDRTGWPVRLITSFCWHQNTSSITV